MTSNIQRPLDNYDAPAWLRYYASRPDLKRSVGAEGDDGDEDDEDGKVDQPDIGKAVADAVAAAMAPVVAGMTALQQKMQTPVKEEEEDEDDSPGGKGGGEEVDFDLMTNKELVSHFQNEMVMMGKAFAKELNNMRSSGERTAAQVEAERVASKHDDFWDLKEEIGKEIKGNMYLTIEQAYKLAKVNNPDKVKTLQEAKEAKGKDGKDTKKEKEEEEDRKEMPFGGLLPTSGRVRPNQKMSMKDAGEAAWQSIFGTANTNSVN